MVVGLPPTGPTLALGLDVGAKVHVGRVEPHEEWLVSCGLVLDERRCRSEELLVDGLHPLSVERAGVLDALCPIAVGPRVHHTAGTEALSELGHVFGLGVVVELGLLLGIQVIKIAEEFVEPVHRRKVFIAVPEVILAELASGIAMSLEGGGDGGVFRLETQGGTRQADLRKTRTDRILTADERRPASRTALLPVVVGEANALGGDAIDVRRPVPHEAIAVATQIADPNVIAPDHQDVWLFARHGVPSKSSAWPGASP